jgi:hypothetical protein
MIYHIIVCKYFLFQFQQHIEFWAKPATLSLISGVLSDLTCSRSDLIVENALFRQPLIVLNRQVKRPLLTRRDRFLLVLLVRCSRFWKQALHIVQPDTLLRWHRELFRFYCGHRFRHPRTKNALPGLLANGVCERFMGSLRRECLEHTLILHRKHLTRVMKEYTNYFNQERPHQGIGQRIPNFYDRPVSNPTGNISSRAILGCLHHSYFRVTDLH